MLIIWASYGMILAYAVVDGDLVTRLVVVVGGYWYLVVPVVCGVLCTGLGLRYFVFVVLG